jgi:hypothetical protein
MPTYMLGVTPGRPGRFLVEVEVVSAVRAGKTSQDRLKPARPAASLAAAHRAIRPGMSLPVDREMDLRHEQQPSATRWNRPRRGR